MKLKKWLLIFFGTLLACALLITGFNVVTDPFGVFGDPFFQWYEYDMTMNPRVAKIAWLDRNYSYYDSYIIGSSKASSLPVEELNRYTGAQFYNMTWYGGDLKDERELVHYLTEHYNVENLVLAIDPSAAAAYGWESDRMKENMHCRVDGSSPLSFYSRYLLCNPTYGAEKIQAFWNRGYLTTADTVYTVATGCYDKQRRDASPIGDIRDYMTEEEAVIPDVEPDLPYMEEALDSIQDIIDTCEANGVELTIVGVPLENEEFYGYDPERVGEFWTRLAGMHHFYEFWGDNVVNADMRYFYDVYHFRNDTGRMALAYLFDDDTVYVPQGFGHYDTPQNVAARIEDTYAEMSGTGTSDTDRAAAGGMTDMSVETQIDDTVVDDPVAVTDSANVGVSASTAGSAETGSPDLPTDRKEAENPDATEEPASAERGAGFDDAKDAAAIGKTPAAEALPDDSSYTTRVPILVYHSFTENPDEVGGTVVLKTDFESQLAALAAAGYQSVMYQDLIDYVDQGKELPERPVLITFDDGYLNNLTLAVPLLEQYGFTSEISIIGVSDGKMTYKNTGKAITTHFSLEEARPYVEEGVIMIRSHSYDMHQVKERDGGQYRKGVLPKKGEKEKAYIRALTGDYRRSAEQIEAALDIKNIVYTYPYGLRNELSEVLLHDLGNRVTVTLDSGSNVIIKGLKQSLYQLKRFAVTGGMSAEELLASLETLDS